MRFSWLLIVAACGSSKPVATASQVDPASRSRQLFGQMAKVLMHPRCVNCHPADDTPRQGNDHGIHDPPVLRGASDRGVVGMQCTTCHQERNAELARIPGAPGWHLAPVQMAWLGKSAAQICEQLKDPARNGGRSLAQIQDHLAHDPLVGWGWNPGGKRTLPPLTRDKTVAAMQTWIDSGGACPE